MIPVSWVRNIRGINCKHSEWRTSLFQLVLAHHTLCTSQTCSSSYWSRDLSAQFSTQPRKWLCYSKSWAEQFSCSGKKTHFSVWNSRSGLCYKHITQFGTAELLRSSSLLLATPLKKCKYGFCRMYTSTRRGKYEAFPKKSWENLLNVVVKYICTAAFIMFLWPLLLSLVSQNKGTGISESIVVRWRSSNNS